MGYRESHSEEYNQLYGPFFEQAMKLEAGESFAILCKTEGEANRIAYHLREHFATEGLGWRFQISQKESPTLRVRDMRPTAVVGEIEKVG